MSIQAKVKSGISGRVGNQPQGVFSRLKLVGVVNDGFFCRLASD